MLEEGEAMKKNKIILVGSILAFVFVSCIRIYWVNKDIEKQKVECFGVNETVEFGEDFNINSSKIIDGYSVEVVDSEILTTEKFYEQNGINVDNDELMDSNIVKYYYVVKTVFTNKDNLNGETSGIDLSNIVLVGKDYSVVASSMAYELINPEMPRGLGFSLLPDTSLEVLIPYAIIPGNMAQSEKDAYMKLTTDPPMIQITSYPTKKLIKTK